MGKEDLTWATLDCKQSLSHGLCSIVLCIRAQNNIFEFRALIKILLVRDFEKRKEGRLKSFHGQMKRRIVSYFTLYLDRQGWGGAKNGTQWIVVPSTELKRAGFLLSGVEESRLGLPASASLQNPSPQVLKPSISVHLEDVLIILHSPFF